MILESLLAYAHLGAILAMVVFSTSEAALCRAEWMNAAVVRRLAAVDRIYWIAMAAVLLTGLARMVWGVKGPGWYGTNGLLHLKLALFAAIAGLSVKPWRAFRAWRAALDATGALPDPEAVRAVRRRVMVSTHLTALLPLAAVFLARGFGGA